MTALLRVTSQFALLGIQDGGRPPYWMLYLGNRLTNPHEIRHTQAEGNSCFETCAAICIAANQRWRPTAKFDL
jgi:hypothetical protein